MAEPTHSNEWVSSARTCEMPQNSPWRVGRKVGRTIYVMVSGEPGDDDELIGVMDSPAVSAAAVDAHNGLLKPWSKCCGFPIAFSGKCTGCQELCDAC